VSAPQKYKITAVIGKRPWKPSGEDVVKTIYYDLDVDGVGKCSLGLPPSDPEPEPGKEVFAILTPQDGYPPKLVIPKQGQGGKGGGFRGKSPEELAHDKANSALIRAKEFCELTNEVPTIKEFSEIAAKMHTLLTKLASGQVVIEP
jgi:hypothetical protein